MAPRRIKRASSRGPAEKKANVGHVLGQEELAVKNEKVASFVAKDFPSPVEVGIAAGAGIAAMAVMMVVTVFSFANVFVFRVTPAVFGYLGIMELYSQINSPAKQDVVTTGTAFLGLLYAHLAFAFGRKRVSHNHQAMHGLLFAVASYNVMGMLGYPVGTLLGFDFTTSYIKENMAELGSVVGTMSGVVVMIGHMVSPHVDHVISQKGCSGRAKHVVN